MGMRTVSSNGQVEAPAPGPQVDLQAAFEAFRFQTGQEVSRLMAEIAMRDAYITQLQAQLAEWEGAAPSPSPS